MKRVLFNIGFSAGCGIASFAFLAHTLKDIDFAKGGAMIVFGSELVFCTLCDRRGRASKQATPSDRGRTS